MKRRLCILTLIVAVFIGIKEASAQKRIKRDTINDLNTRDPGRKDYKDGIGQDSDAEYQIPANRLLANEPYSFAMVEVLPKFPGGEEASYSYFQRKIKIDPTANNNRVIVSFIVEKDVSLTDIKVLRGFNAEADKLALQILKKSPKWVPGMQAGKAVRVNYTMPIQFYN